MLNVVKHYMFSPKLTSASLQKKLALYYGQAGRRTGVPACPLYSHISWDRQGRLSSCPPYCKPLMQVSTSSEFTDSASEMFLL